MARLVLLPDRLVDPRTATMIEDRAMIIIDDRIEALISKGEVASDSATIDLSGHTLLPGLIDCHTHLVGEVDSGQGYATLVTKSGAEEALIGVKHAGETLRAGFTTVRDVGTFRAFGDVALRHAIEGGGSKGRACSAPGVSSPVPAGAATSQD